MAVYTNLKIEQVIAFLKSYNIGELISFNGITEGIENSNFYIKTSTGEFILTIFEKRVNRCDLPFFVAIMKHLSKKNFVCPTPIFDKKKKYLQELEKKPALIVNFLKGKSKTKINAKDCFKLGNKMASMHLKSKDFFLERKNSLSIEGWEQLINSCSNSISINNLNEIEHNILEEIQNSFNFCKKNWPNNLPKGFIHGDIFPDNVFFQNNEISGIIDFYFSCTDFFAYDIAVAVNAWCFDDQKKFNKKKFSSLIEGYSLKRRLSEQEFFYLPLLSQAAALRFLLTRIYDWAHTPKNADVRLKDPKEYIEKLRFHKSIATQRNYDEK